MTTPTKKGFGGETVKKAEVVGLMYGNIARYNVAITAVTRSRASERTCALLSFQICFSQAGYALQTRQRNHTYEKHGFIFSARHADFNCPTELLEFRNRWNVYIHTRHTADYRRWMRFIYISVFHRVQEWGERRNNYHVSSLCVYTPTSP